MKNSSSSKHLKQGLFRSRGLAVAAISTIMMLAGVATATADNPEGASSQGQLPLQIIVTAAGSNTVYSSTESSFAQDIKRSLRIFQTAEITQQGPAEAKTQEGKQDEDQPLQRLVNIKVGEREYDFKVDEQIPIIRFEYDRNRRALTAQGLNSLESDPTQSIVYPTFKGTPLTDLWDLWSKDIADNMNKATFEQESVKPLILEFDIDEDGYVRNIQDLGGTLKSYSQICISTIYDIAARDWTPTQINGQTVRAKALVILQADSQL